MHIIHKWSKWSELLKTYDGHKQQWKICTECNKATFRILSWDKQTPLDQVIEAIKGISKCN